MFRQIRHSLYQLSGLSWNKKRNLKFKVSFVNQIKAEILQEKFNYTVPTEVIKQVGDCSVRAVDANTVELGSPDLWTHNLENGFYIIPFYFDADHTGSYEELKYSDRMSGKLERLKVRSETSITCKRH